MDKDQRKVFRQYFAQYWRLQKFYGAKDFAERPEMISRDAQPYIEICVNRFEPSTKNIRSLFHYCMLQTARFLSPHEFASMLVRWLESQREAAARPILPDAVTEMLADYQFCSQGQAQRIVSVVSDRIRAGVEKFPNTVLADIERFEEAFRSLLVNQGLTTEDLKDLDLELKLWKQLQSPEVLTTELFEYGKRRFNEPAEEGAEQ